GAEEAAPDQRAVPSTPPPWREPCCTATAAQPWVIPRCGPVNIECLRRHRPCRLRSRVAMRPHRFGADPDHAAGALHFRATMPDWFRALRAAPKCHACGPMSARDQNSAAKGCDGYSAKHVQKSVEQRELGCGRERDTEDRQRRRERP